MIKARNGFVAILLLAIFGLFGCSLVTVDEADFGSIQELDVGDLLVIQLTGNATTGYEWVRSKPASLEGSPIEIVKEGGYQTLGCQSVGASGEYVFRYRAMRLGTVTLEFEYRRPWDPEDPIDTYSVTAWVR